MEIEFAPDAEFLKVMISLSKIQCVAKNATQFLKKKII